MDTKLRLSVISLALALAGCDGGRDEVGTAETAALDTPSMTMEPGMPGGMRPMAGMGPEMMRSEWERHMATMHAATGDSLRAMMPMHRQMVTSMMETMGGRMGMGMDSTSMATRDSLRGDLDRMRNMTPEEMEAFLEEHDARMQRMLRMHQASPQ
jgi:hypothetical protein